VKIELRWQLLLAASCVILLASLVGFQIQTSGQCTTVAPSAGGRLIQGVVGLPQYINPLLSKSNPVDQDLVQLIFDGLTRYNSRGQLEPVLATKWTVSDDGLRYRFEIAEDRLWHDGQPVTAQDVIFTYSLLQNESFPVNEATAKFWQSVSVQETDEGQVEFVLPEPFSPFLEATTLGILPAQLLSDVQVNDVINHSFNKSPVGTGPFMVVPGSDWQRDGYLRLAPNPIRWHGGTSLDGIEYRFYPDLEAMAQALADGELQSLDLPRGSNLGDFGEMDEIRFFTSSRPSFTQLLFNFNGQETDALKAIEVRRALAHSIDRAELIDESVEGQGLGLEGPYLPNSIAFDPAIMAPIEFDIIAAGVNLDSAGWVLSDDSGVRTREGESLEIKLLVEDQFDRISLADQIAESWQRVGILTEIDRVNSANFANALSEGEFDVAIVDIEPIGDPDLYDFWSQEAIIDGQNYGSWNNRLASEALERARKLTSVGEKASQYDTFLRLFREDLPALTLFQHVRTFGIGEAIEGVEIGRIDSIRERYDTFNDWIMMYSEVAVPCPEDTS
jgi:peptide/nickel transport system substrate-binding protein